MRAARFVAPRHIAVESVAVPDVAAGEVRVRIEGCGVCASNLGPYLGVPGVSYPRGPGEGGHEAWGHVDVVGAGVRGLSGGERVAILSQRSYAEYDVVPAAHVLPLPSALASIPFPAEAIGCALNAFARSSVCTGQTVAVVGIGFLGALLVQLAKGAGARVVAVSRRPEALVLARRCGADVALPLAERRAAAEAVAALSGGAMCERVIEAVGNQEALDLASELVGVRGTLVIAGYHQDGPRKVDLQSWNWRGLDIVNAHERAPEAYLRAMRAAVQATLAGRIDPRPLLTHRFGLDRLGSALEAARARPAGFVKAYVAP